MMKNEPKKGAMSITRETVSVYPMGKDAKKKKKEAVKRMLKNSKGGY